MKLEKRIENKFRELIDEAERLKYGNKYGQVTNDDHAYRCKSWLVSAQNLVHLVVGNPHNPYRISVDNICSQKGGFLINKSVGEVASILQTLLGDISNGLLASIENQTKALVFDDFLEHAKAYIRQKKKNEAGVIAGVVFEDTIRNICRINRIKERGVKLDTLITELTKHQIIPEIKAKHARVAAGVRTKATHAQWDEFDLFDVKTTIEFTEELINANLADRNI